MFVARERKKKKDNDKTNERAHKSEHATNEQQQGTAEKNESETNESCQT